MTAAPRKSVATVRPRRRISRVRGVVHFVGLALNTMVLQVILLPTRLLPFRIRYPAVTLWSRVNVWWLRLAAGVDHRIEGWENVPDQRCIVVANHQSSWETIVFETLFRPHCWVLKQEFLRIPFAGWGAALLEPIAVDRSAGHRSVRQLVRTGCDRLRLGRWVIVFPEGTRTAPGKRRRYHVGAGALARASGVPVLPVAHNSGLFWPRHSPILYQGTVRLRIGPPISPEGRSAKEIVAAAEAWIQAQMPDLLQDTTGTE